MTAAPSDRNLETPPHATDSDAIDATPVASIDSRSTAEVLKGLRHAFPDMPLAERVAALTALSRT